MSELNILRIYPFITEGKGGMENHIRMLSAEQQRAGNSVSILYSQGERLSESDICILRNWPYKKIKPQAISLFVFHIRGLIELLIKPKTFDVVHIHGDWSSYLFAWLYKRITKSKSIAFSFHGQLKNSFAHRRLLPILAKRADVMFVNGYNAYEKLVSSSKTIFRPSGVDELFYTENALLKKSDNINFTVISVGNLIPSKNMITVVNIAQQLPTVEFKIVGKGYQLEMLKQYSDRLGVKNITFVGFLNKANLKPLLEDSDLFMLCSLEEGTPTVILEAMAVGLPIITSEAGGISSVIKNNENGFVVQESKDINGYIDQLNNLIGNRELREKISVTNKASSLDYKWQKVAEIITSNYV